MLRYKELRLTTRQKSPASEEGQSGIFQLEHHLCGCGVDSLSHTQILELTLSIHYLDLVGWLWGVKRC